MNYNEEREARLRAQERERAGFTDIGALWHSVSCLCQQCMDTDVHAIGLAKRPITAERLFVAC